eukprot:g6188.t1
MHCVERMVSITTDKGTNFKANTSSSPGFLPVDSKTRVSVESSRTPSPIEHKKRVKTLNDDWLKSISYAPRFTPSLSEFSSDPVRYLRQIETEASSFGLCKIQIPEHYRTYVNELPIHLTNFSFTAREQKLREHNWESFGTHAAGIIYEHEKPFKLNEFRKCVQESGEKLLKDATLLPPSHVESEFWRQRNSVDSKDVFILYGNDVEGTACIKDDPRNIGSTPWNLQSLAKASWSLLHHTSMDYPGVTTPMLYIGSLFSTFFWHVEDHWMHSINYSHHGAIKTWYGVPASHADAFEKIVFEKVYKTALQDLRKQHKNDPEFIRKSALKQLLAKNTLFHPKILIDAGIPVYKLDQYPGDFVVTFPRAYHSGFSHGFNIGEAVNFAIPEWLEVGKTCLEKYCYLQIPQILPHQMLILKSAASVLDSIRKQNRTKATKDHNALREAVLNQRGLIEVELEQPLRNYICFLCYRQITGAFVRHRETNGVRCMQCTKNAKHIDASEWDLASPQVVKLIQYLYQQLRPYYEDNNNNDDDDDDHDGVRDEPHPVQYKIPRKSRSPRGPWTGKKRKLRPQMTDQGIECDLHLEETTNVVHGKFMESYSKRDVLRVVDKDWILVASGALLKRTILEDENEEESFILGEELLRSIDAPIQRQNDVDEILLRFLRLTDPDLELVKRPVALPNKTEKCTSSYDRLSDTKSAAAIGVVTGGVLLVSGVYFITRSRRRSKAAKPGVADLSGGSLDRDEVRKAFADFSDSYGKDAGVGIVEKSRTASLVNTFYNLVTDFYEWGWGESFHFSMPLPGKTELASEVAHETRLAVLCNLKPGMKCVDLGCGVGGPMRTVAAFSGAEITGVTINQYQVDRANYHNKRYGMEELCRAVQGSFLNLNFPNECFDAAYAVEATCHAPDVSIAYGEAFRVLKPGAIFVSYEWVTTPQFDPTNPVHVKAIDDINYGNGLPDMRSAKECIEAGKKVGFELVDDYDWVNHSKVCKPWYARLEKIHDRAIYVNRFFVNLLSFLHLLPSGIKQVHDMLLDAAAKGLIIAGKEVPISLDVNFDALKLIDQTQITLFTHDTFRQFRSSFYWFLKQMQTTNSDCSRGSGSGNLTSSCEDEICWICLESSRPENPLLSPCRCPRKVHESCLARWQLQQAGKDEEQFCRFCLESLPDWRPRLTPGCLRENLCKARPTMMVTFRKKICYVPVSPGPDGLEDFTRSIKQHFGLKDDANINVSFGCREPLTGSYLKLEGHGAFDAAVHCASISAASRERQKLGLPPVENATYSHPDAINRTS